MFELKYKLETAAENPESFALASSRVGSHWPEFMLHDPVAELLDVCRAELPDFQFILTAPNTGEAVALGNSIPLRYEGKLADLPETGWDWALAKGIDDFRAGRKPNIQCALQVVVFDEYRGQGVSKFALISMKHLGQDSGLKGLIAPVRPNRKHESPAESIDDYILHSNDQGAPFDPWLRVHYSIGADIIKPCHQAMTITGTVAEWESWTGLKFKESGQHIVPGALVEVEIDLERDLGRYIEPNVWMHHP